MDVIKVHRDTPYNVGNSRSLPLLGLVWTLVIRQLVRPFLNGDSNNNA